MQRILTFGHLLDVTGARHSSGAVGTVVANFELWDGRILEITVECNDKDCSALVFSEEIVSEDQLLWPLAMKIFQGKSCFIKKGEGETLQTLRLSTKE